MSSRALRKLRREQEERERLASASHEISDAAKDSDEEFHERDTPKTNAFDLLNAALEEVAPDDDDENNPMHSSDAEEGSKNPPQSTQGKLQSQPRNKKKKKSKKKKDNGKGKESPNEQPGVKSKAELDDIDLALLSLKEKKSDPQDDANNDNQRPNEKFLQLYRKLSIDTKHLNALNEMKKLFGNVVLEEENEEAAPPAQARRRERGRQRLDLGGALGARNSPVSRGQGLVGLALRRNVFMMGKESWPKAASGGLAMEVVEKAWDQTTEYRFVHATMYQDVQKQFYSCVQSGDPQRMIQLLQYNPYHIATLLVVSEIAEHQGDHSVSGELLERALFSFGRSVHSSFHTALAEGKARFDFRRPENREFWLVAWRYISCLGQRGTWRTAYEWAKLLLSLDPEYDPYCIHLIIDQLALRGGQGENFCELVDAASPLFSWASDSSNIRISRGLAEYRLKKPERCRETLRSSVKSYPWIFARLFQELNIDHIPKAIWGKMPRTLHERLQTEYYAIRAKDLWNSPEAISFLMEVVESVQREALILKVQDTEISLNEARHVLLCGVPSLIALLPRHLTEAKSYSFDILPPEENINSYDSDQGDYDDTDEHEDHPTNASSRPPVTGATAEERELQGLRSFFTRLIPWLDSSRNQNNPLPTEGELLEQAPEIEQILNDSGISPEEMFSRTARLFELEELYATQGDEDGDDDEDFAMPPLIEENVQPSGSNEGVNQNDDSNVSQSGDSNMPHLEFDDDEMPPLIPETIQPLGPREEGIRPYEPPDTPTTATPQSRQPFTVLPGGIILANLRPGRHAYDSSDEDDLPSLQPASSTSTLPATTTSQPEPYDDQRNQRWLVGTGLSALKDFVAEHGTNETDWWGGENTDTEPVIEYAQRVKQLQRQATRNWVLNYILQPQTSGDVKALVMRFMERARP